MSSSSAALSRLFRNATTRLPAISPPPKNLPPSPGSSPIRRPDREAESAAAAIFSQPDPNLVVSLFKQASALPRFRAKHRVYEFAVRRLAAAGHLPGVAEILEHQKSYPSDISREGFATRLISLYGVAAMPDAAEETFYQLPSFGCPQTSLSFNALLSACSSSGDLKKLDSLFHSIPSENPSIVPNVISYNILVSSRCRAGELDEALRIVETMEGRGFEPNLVTFNTLLSAFYLKGRFSEAEEIWEKMLQKKLAPDLKSYNAKARGLATAGRMEEALEVVMKLPILGLKPETTTFNALIKGYCIAGEAAEAKKVFDDLPAKGCKPNTESYETIVAKLLEDGEVEEALRLCRESMGGSCRVRGEIVKEVVGALKGCSREMDAQELLKISGVKVE